MPDGSHFSSALHPTASLDAPAAPGTYPFLSTAALAERAGHLRAMAEAVGHTLRLHRDRYPQMINSHGSWIWPRDRGDSETEEAKLAVIRRRQLADAEDALNDEMMALDELIIATRAHSGLDGLAQIMVARAFLESVMDEDADADRKRRWGPLDRALAGSIKALASEFGVRLGSLDGRSKLSAWCDPAPDLNDLRLTMPEPTFVDLVADELLPQEPAR